jgi:hypothetical protein
LHYYFPWAVKTLMKWAIFCTVTGRRMQLDSSMRKFYDVADDASLSWEDKLASYRRLTDDCIEAERYEEFCAKHLPHADEVMVEYIESRQFDDHMVRTIRAAFPADEHDKFVARYRGLISAWASDQRAQA